MAGSKKKLEADISSAFIKFQRELIGRGPQETKTYIGDDMVIIRLKGKGMRISHACMNYFFK
jgi:uncharacterized protein YbcI